MPVSKTCSISALAVAACAFFIAVPAFAQEGDVAAGKTVFKKCAACHAAGEGAKNKVGPVLTGVIGRTAGTYADYRYGDSIIAAGKAGLVWDEDEVFAYLENPRDYLRAKLSDPKARSKMAFRLKKEEERRDVIAYLKSVSQ